MQCYSYLFTTLFDELVAPSHMRLGYGSHYSVLRAVLWPGSLHQAVSRYVAEPIGPILNDFCVVWDADHDARVIWFIEQLHVRRMLDSVLFVGEHKGHVTVLTNLHRHPEHDGLSETVDELAAQLPCDPWTGSAHRFDDPDDEADVPEYLCRLIQDEPVRVEAYLGWLQTLWWLGRKPLEFRTPR